MLNVCLLNTFIIRNKSSFTILYYNTPDLWNASYSEKKERKNEDRKKKKLNNKNLRMPP